MGNTVVKRFLQLSILLTALMWCVPAHATFTAQAGGTGNNIACTTATCAVSLTFSAGWVITVESFVNSTQTLASCCNNSACSVAWVPLATRSGANDFELTYLCPSALAGTFAVGPTWSGLCTSTGCGTSVQSWTSSLGTVAKDSGATPTAGCLLNASSPDAWCPLTVSGNNHIFIAAGVTSGNFSGCNPAGCTTSVNNGNGNGWIANAVSYSSNAWTVSSTGSGGQVAAAIQETGAASSCPKTLRTLGVGCF